MINHVWVVVGQSLTDVEDCWPEWTTTSRREARAVRNDMTRFYYKDGIKAKFSVKKFTLNKETK